MDHDWSNQQQSCQFTPPTFGRSRDVVVVGEKAIFGRLHVVPSLVIVVVDPWVAAA